MEGLPLDALIAKELIALQQETWVPYFAARGAKSFAHDSYYLSSKKVTYPSRGRKMRTPGKIIIIVVVISMILIIDLIVVFVSGLENYYAKYLPYITLQPLYKPEVAASIFEANLSIVTEQRGNDNNISNN